MYKAEVDGPTSRIEKYTIMVGGLNVSLLGEKLFSLKVLALLQERERFSLGSDRKGFWSSRCSISWSRW